MQYFLRAARRYAKDRPANGADMTIRRATTDRRPVKRAIYFDQGRGWLNAVPQVAEVMQNSLPAVQRDAEDGPASVRAAFRCRPVQLALYFDERSDRVFAIARGAKTMEHSFRTALRDAENRPAGGVDGLTMHAAASRRAVERALYVDQRCLGLNAIGLLAELMQYVLGAARRDAKDGSALVVARALRIIATLARRAVQRAAHVDQARVRIMYVERIVR